MSQDNRIKNTPLKQPTTITTTNTGDEDILWPHQISNGDTVTISSTSWPDPVEIVDAWGTETKTTEEVVEDMLVNIIAINNLTEKEQVESIMAGNNIFKFIFQPSQVVKDAEHYRNEL